MHVQPPLPEVGIHGEDRLPVGGKLGMARVRPAVLQGQHLRKMTGWTGKRQCSARACLVPPREHRDFSRDQLSRPRRLATSLAFKNCLTENN